MPLRSTCAACELTHGGADVTFETVLHRYDLTDPILSRIAKIVRQADLEDDRFDAPAAAGLDTIIRAVGANHPDEQVRPLSAEILTSLELHLRNHAICH